jgi:hypothetical protein
VAGFRRGCGAIELVDVDVHARLDLAEGVEEARDLQRLLGRQRARRQRAEHRLEARRHVGVALDLERDPPLGVEPLHHQADRRHVALGRLGDQCVGDPLAVGLGVVEPLPQAGRAVQGAGLLALRVARAPGLEAPARVACRRLHDRLLVSSRRSCGTTSLTSKRLADVSGI